MLTAQQRKKAYKWWITEAIRKEGVACNFTKNDIENLISSIDSWLEAAPDTGFPTNLLSLTGAVSAYTGNLNSTQLILIIVAVGLAKSNRI